MDIQDLYSVLVVAGCPLNHYRTLYYDTAGFALYQHRLQQILYGCESSLPLRSDVIWSSLHPAAGSVTVKVDPLPGVLSTWMAPPWASTSDRAIANPRPDSLSTWTRAALPR
jgi:hypothetical protein